MLLQPTNLKPEELKLVNIIISNFKTIDGQTLQIINKKKKLISRENTVKLKPC